MADPAIRSEQIEAIRTALPEGWQLVELTGPRDRNLNRECGRHAGDGGCSRR